MARDLDVPVEIVGVEIVRDADGLALSSRNVYLSAEQRAEAPRIRRGLAAAAAAFASGERRAVELVKIARGPLDACPLMRVDYLEARSIETLDEVVEAREGDTLLAAAVYMGTTRLIDNVRL